MSLQAQILIDGPAEELALMRRRLDALLRAEGAERYRELHTAGQLDYRMTVPGGIPFPAFVQASAEFPAATVRVSWADDPGGEHGEATISNGKLAHQRSGSTKRPGGPCRYVTAAADGTIGLALVAESVVPGHWIGYAVTCDRHAWLEARAADDSLTLHASEGIAESWSHRWQGSRAAGSSLERTSIDEAIAPDVLSRLEALAAAFVDEWIWFEEEPPIDIALERHRFEQYGFTVRPANLKSARLRGTLTAAGEGSRFSEVPADADWLVRLVEAALRTIGQREDAGS